jgi:hypothetical protein
MEKSAVEWLETRAEKRERNNPNSSAFWHLRELIKDFEQAKEMEKEQKIAFAEFVAKYPDKNRNVNGDLLHAKSKYDESERTIDLLEQYYNQTFKTE